MNWAHEAQETLHEAVALEHARRLREVGATVPSFVAAAYSLFARDLRPEAAGGITPALVVAGVHGSLCCHRRGRGRVVRAAAGLWGLFWLWAGLCGSGAWKALVGADGAVAAVSSACARVRAKRMEGSICTFCTSGRFPQHQAEKGALHVR